MSSERSGAAPPAAIDVEVGRTVARLGRQVEAALAGVDLTIAQYRVLIQLNEGAQAASSLADRLVVSRPTLTAVVEGLTQRGLVKRQKSRDDRRWVSLALTEQGRRSLALADDVVQLRLAAIVAELSESQAAMAISGVAQWRVGMDKSRARRANERQARADG
jgi:long-chain acyl-CoA synthetase